MIQHINQDVEIWTSIMCMQLLFDNPDWLILKNNSQQIFQIANSKFKIQRPIECAEFRIE